MAPFGYSPPPSTGGGGGGGGGAGEVEIAVTVAASKFVLDGVSQQDFTILPGMIYKFDVSHTSNTGHVFSLSLTDDNSGSSEYTTGRTRDGTPGGGGSENVQWDVPLDVADTVYYYCSNHSAMGGTLGKANADTVTTTETGLTAADIAVSTAGLEKDIAALAFKVASTNSLEKFSLDNQIIDDFKTQADSAIDASLSTDEAYAASQAGLLDTGNRWSGFVPQGSADSDWDDVVLLISGDETYGATFTDKSDTPHTITANGSVIVQTTGNGGKFGEGYTFGGTGSDYWSIPDSADWTFGSAPFTIEFWIYPEAIATNTSTKTIFSHGDVGSHEHFLQLYVYNSSELRLDWNVRGGISTNMAVYGSETVITPEVWTHVALVRDGTLWSMYCNGKFIKSHSGPSGSIEDYDDPFLIGYRPASTSKTVFFGELDDLRITKGVARYSGTTATAWGNFSEITTAFPTTDTPGTNLAYNDISLVSNAQTASVAPATADIVMMYDDTVGTATLNTDIKAWASRDNGTTWTEGVLVAGDDAGGEKTASANDISLAGQPSGTSIRYKITTHNQSATKLTSIGGVSLGWDDPTTATVTSGSTLASIAAMEFTSAGLEDSIATLGFKVAAQNSLAKFDLPNQIIDDFKTQADSAVDESASTNITTDSYGAHSSAAGRWNGYVAYQAGGDQHWSNVTFLLQSNSSANGSTSFTDVSGTTPNTLTSNNGAAHSTSAYKWGTSSIFIDNSNDSITAPDNADFMPAGNDWTIECWIKRADTSGDDWFWGNTNANINGGWAFHITTGNVLQCRFIANSTYNVSGPSIADTNWHHIAAVRNGGTLTVYVDGVPGSGQSISGSYPTDNNFGLTIGSLGPYNSPYTGARCTCYTDDLRITIGTARYTGNFSSSLPTAAFPIGGGTAQDEEWNDIALVSDAQTATIAPSTGDVVVLYDDTIGAATLNTDIKAWVSRDNGTTYTEGILVASDASIGGEKIASAHDIAIAAQPSGTQVRYKITTHNQSATKLTSIGGVSLGWKDPATATVTAGGSGGITDLTVATGGLEDDIAALAFKVAAANSLDDFNLSNQLVDDFKTQADSAIDESASTNITTDSYGASQAGLLDTGSRWSGFVQGSEADSLWGDVGFMWNGNETVSGGTFTAESGIAGSGHTVTVTGATQTNASGGKFSGVNAFEFAGSSTGHKLEIPIAALDSVGYDHFTLEFWIYHPDPLPTDSPNPNHWLIDAGVGGSSGEWDIRLRGDGGVGGRTGHRLQSVYHGDDNEIPTLGQWNHYVWLVENDTGPQNRMETNSYLNGEWCNGYAFARSGWALNLGTTLTIGRDLREGYKIGGVRFTKGMRYKGMNSTTPWSNYLADGTTPWTEITSVFPNSLIAGNAQYNNIELISDAQTATTAPSSGDVVLLYADTVGTAVLNTDIKAWVSRNNGTTWTEGVLVGGDTVGNEKLASAHDIDISGQASGTAIRYKITTHNQSATKLTSIGGVSFGWTNPSEVTYASVTAERGVSVVANKSALQAIAPSGTTGQFYFVTATKAMYYSNGSVWTLLGSDAPGWGSFTEDYGILDHKDSSGALITHTPSGTGVAGNGVPMATSTLSVTDEPEAIHEFASTGVTVSNCLHSPAHTGSKTLVEAGVTVGASSGEITITSPHAWEGDSVTAAVTATDGVNILNKNLQWVVRSDAPTDQYIDKVILLITGNEVVSGGTFTSSDPTGHTVTVSGGASQSTSIVPFTSGQWSGGSSWEFRRSNGSDSNADRLTIPAHADFGFGENLPMTMEWWAYHSTDTETGYMQWWAQNQSGSNTGLGRGIAFGSHMTYGLGLQSWLGNGNNNTQLATGAYNLAALSPAMSPALAEDEWFHIAVTFKTSGDSSNPSFKLWLNGQYVSLPHGNIVGHGLDWSNYAGGGGLGNASWPLMIGGTTAGYCPRLDGNIAGFRITKDTERYTDISGTTAAWSCFDEPSSMWGLVAP